MKQEPILNEELLTKWIDGIATPQETALVEKAVQEHPEILADRDQARSLSTLLQTHLPNSLELPSPDFFTNSILAEITPQTPVIPAAPTPWWRTLWRSAWLAPVASAAAVALTFTLWPSSTPPSSQTTVYAPDPRVKVDTYYSESAQATVIELQNLDALPSERNVRAFDIADAEPAAPGTPQPLYTTSDRANPVFIVSKDGAEKPRIELLQP